MGNVNECCTDNCGKLKHAAEEQGRKLLNKTQMSSVSEKTGNINLIEDEMYIANFEWTLNEDDMKTVNNLSNGKCIFSPYFESRANTKWYLTLYGKGRTAGDRGHASLYLNVDSYPSNVKAMQVRYMIKCAEIDKDRDDHDGDDQGKRIRKAKITKQYLKQQNHNDHGYHKFCSQEILKKLTLKFIVYIETFAIYDNSGTPTHGAWLKNKHRNYFQVVDSVIKDEFDRYRKILKCKWTIPKNQMKKFKGLETGNCAQSKYFCSTNDIFWCFSCYPNGEEKKNNISFSIHVHSWSKTVRAMKIKCSIESEQLNTINNFTDSISKTNIISKYCPSQKLTTNSDLVFDVTIIILECIDNDIGIEEKQYVKVSKCFENWFDKKAQIQRVKWTIPKDQIEQFKQLPKGRDSDHFEIRDSDYRSTEDEKYESENKSVWYLSCIPNVSAKKNYCTLSLCLASTPQNCHKITAYCYLLCVETGSCVEEVIELINDNKHSTWSWPKRAQLSSEFAACNSISFECGIRILKVKDRSNSTVYDYEQFLKPAQISKKQQINWHVNKTSVVNFQKMETSWGKRIDPCLSSNDNKQIFSLQCYPKGDKKERKGYLCFDLKMHMFPLGVEAMEIRYNLQCEQLEETKVDECTIGKWKSKCKTGAFPIKFCDSSQLSQHESLDFMIDIEILKLYCKNAKKKIIEKKDVKFKPTGSSYMKVGDYKEIDPGETVKQNPLIVSLIIKKYNTKYKDIEGVDDDIGHYKRVFVKEFGYTLISNMDMKEYGDTMDREKTVKFLKECRGKLFDDDKKLKYDSMFVTVGAHGGNNAIVCSDGKLLQFKDIRQLFQYDKENDMKLTEIPSIYLIDACRSKLQNNDVIISDEKEESDDKPVFVKTNSTTLFGTSEGNIVKGGKIAEIFSECMHKNYEENHEFQKDVGRWSTFYRTYRTMAEMFVETKSDHEQALNLDAHDPNVDDIRFIPKPKCERGRGYKYDNDYSELEYDATIVKEGETNAYDDTRIKVKDRRLSITYEDKQIDLNQGEFKTEKVKEDKTNKIIITSSSTRIEIECSEKEVEHWCDKLADM
eukprot:255720_1